MSNIIQNGQAPSRNCNSKRYEHVELCVHSVADAIGCKLWGDDIGRHVTLWVCSIFRPDSSHQNDESII